MSERKTFIFHAEWKNILKSYPAELRLELYEAIVDYAMGNELKMSQNASLIFPFLKCKLDEDLSAYNAKCETLKTNGAKGGRPKKETNKNQTKPNGFSKTKSAIDYDNDNELLDNSLELDNNKEKKIIINNNPKKEKDFESVFREFGIELATSDTCGIYREQLAKKYGIRNWMVAMKDFKAHIVAMATESNIMAMESINDFKRYFTNVLAKKNFLSDNSKKIPKQDIGGVVEFQLPPEQWREPCKRLANLEVDAYGTKVMVGVILQDGRQYYCDPELPPPPSRFHYYNALTENYDDTRGHNPSQFIDEIPAGLIKLPIEHFLLQRKDRFSPVELEF